MQGWVLEESPWSKAARLTPVVKKYKLSLSVQHTASLYGLIYTQACMYVYMLWYFKKKNDVICIFYQDQVLSIQSKALIWGKYSPPSSISVLERDGFQTKTKRVFSPLSLFLLHIFEAINIYMYV